MLQVKFKKKGNTAVSFVVAQFQEVLKFYSEMCHFHCNCGFSAIKGRGETFKFLLKSDQT